MCRPPEKKISYPIKRCYKSENFGHSIVFDRENFGFIYFLVQPLGGAVLGDQSFLFKTKKNTSFFAIFTNFFVYNVKFCSRLTSQILYTPTIIWCNTGNRGARKLELFQKTDLWCLKDAQASTLWKQYYQLWV
jgi:hypothetical protein